MDDIIKWLVDTVWALDYPSIFLLMAMESSVIPVPSELVMPPAGYGVYQGKMNAIIVVLCGTFGSLVGSYANYFAAFFLGRPFLLKYGRYVLISEKKLVWVESFFRKHGEISIFIGRLLPVARHLISLPAGLAGMNHLKFSLYTLLGAGFWVSVLTYLGYFLGENWESIREHWILELIAIILFCAVILSGYILWQWKKNKSADSSH